MNSLPAVDSELAPSGSTDVPLLSVKGLVKHFPVKRGVIMNRTVGSVQAVDDVSFDIARGETLALVGESGCGKSTTGRMILRLMPPTAGSIRFQSQEIATLDDDAMRRMRRHLQIIFQDPYASLNPRMTVGDIVTEPMQVHEIGSPAQRSERVKELLDVVGLLPEHARRYPHQFSGGQRQRIAIARAMLKNPPLLLLDEATSALDAHSERMVQAALESAMRGRTTLVIAHRLATVQKADNILVLEHGRLVEQGKHAELVQLGGVYAGLAALQFNAPQSPPR